MPRRALPYPIDDNKSSKSTSKSTSPATKPNQLVPISFIPRSSRPKLKRSAFGNSPNNPPSQSLSLGKFSPPFDLLSELALNRDEYVGTESFTILDVPSYLRTCIDRTRARVISLSKPGLAITCAACITYGIRLISQHPDVKELMRLKEELDMIEGKNIPLDDLEELNSWFRSFSICIPSHTAYTSSRSNIYLTEYLKLELFDLGSELGTSASKLATLAIMVTMADQTNIILMEHATILNQTIDTFLRRIQTRLKVGKILLEDLTDKMRNAEKIK